MTAWAAVVAHNPGLAERRKQALHTVLERNPEEAAAPIVAAHKEAAEAVLSREVVAAPIVVVHKAVEAARRAAVVADSDLAAVVDLDHKTLVIPSCQVCCDF